MQGKCYTAVLRDHLSINCVGGAYLLDSLLIKLRFLYFLCLTVVSINFHVSKLTISSSINSNMQPLL